MKALEAGFGLDAGTPEHPINKERHTYTDQNNFFVLCSRYTEASDLDKVPVQHICSCTVGDRNSVDRGGVSPRALSVAVKVSRLLLIYSFVPEDI